MAYVPPVGQTTDPDIFLENVKRADRLVSGPAETVPDRGGEPLDTWRQMMAKNDEVRQNIIPLSKQYMTLAEAQIDIAHIPESSTTYVRSPDDSALALEYKNVGGLLVATGRRFPAQKQVDKLNDQVKNQTLSFGFFKGKSITSAAADVDGSCIFLTVESGDIYVATGEGMVSVSGSALTYRNTLSYGFHKGEPVLQVNTDKQGSVLSLITKTGTSIISGAGLIDVIPDVDIGSQQRTLSYGFVEGQPVVRLTVDINTGAVSEIVGMDGNIYAYVDGELKKLTNITASETESSNGYIYSGALKTYLGRDMSFYSPDPDITYIFLDMGQSNSWAQYSGGVATIAGTPVYPVNALMLNTGVRATLTTPTSLVPLVETNEGIASETSGSSWVNHTIRDVEALTGIRPTILMINASQGGMRYYQLSRGQTAYKQLLTALKAAVELIKARGKKPVLAAMRWIQGESEVGFAPSTMGSVQAQLRQLQRFVAEDASRLFGSEQNPLLFVNQISASSTYPEGLWRQPVKQAQLLREGPVIPTGPVYQYPMADNVHMNSWGRNYLGQCLAMATVTEIFGSSYTPMMPREYAWIDDVTLRVFIDLEFGSLVIDTTGPVSTASLDNYGFNFDDYSANPPAITSVSVNGNSIDIVLNKAARRSWRLAYAMKANSTSAGPVTGARGCIRDSAGHQNLYDTAVLTYNWLPSFIINSK
ncbi:TPA: sialate O-acetylesterase [Raoultella ornithinolytica]